jgi:hypothetical protein
MLMPGEITALGECFVTLVTLKWSFSRMNTRMVTEMTALGECFVTFIRTFSCKNKDMFPEITTVCKFFTTMKWSFSCVNTFLLNEATMRGYLITMITNICHFPRHKTTVFGAESSVALVTFVRLTHWILGLQITATFERNCKKNRRENKPINT